MILIKLRRIVYKAIICLALFFSPIVIQADETLWDLEKSENGILVYQRTVGDSEYKETYGVVRIESSMDSLVALLKDTGSYESWMYNCSYAVTVEQINDKDRIDYMIFDSPAFISDREVYIYSSFNYNGETQKVTIELESKDHHGDHKYHKGGNVQIVDLKGYWSFNEIASEIVDVRYQIYSNPEVFFVSATDSNMVFSVFNTLNNMRKIVKQATYRDTNIQYKIP